jgi:hypothetical protein
MTQNEKLRALLADARAITQDSLDSNTTGFEAENEACKCNACERYRSIIARIDAALEEPVGDWQPHEDPSRTAYVVQVERERDEAVAAFHEATRLRSGIQQARIKAENERDEARAEVEYAYREGGALHEAKIAQAEAEQERDAAYQRGAEAMREAAAEWFTGDIERAAAGAHEAYQREAHRRGDVRHADAYAELPDATKEWDRVLCRWVAGEVRALPIPEDKP